MHQSILNDDTIAALSTPPGKSGLAVLRLSGPEAIIIINKLFTSVDKISSKHHALALVGTILHPDTNQTVDEVVVTYFKSPHSYTTEDLVEVSCHGGLFIQRQILDLFTQLGARIAEPGEFTRRAFLGGRIDLAQAEAVGDLIAAKVASSHRSSIQRMRGELTRAVENLRKSLIDLAARLELELDFSEEELDRIPAGEIADHINDLIFEVNSLLEGYNTGRIISQGALVPIVGKPNAGKSSLLNALLKFERAIVTPVPGTTRDTIEEEVDIMGYLVRLVDTAGLRASKDKIEQLGVERSLDQIKAADMIIWLIDRTTPFTEEDKQIFKLIENTPHLVIGSKSDLDKHSNYKSGLTEQIVLDISSETNSGMKNLSVKIIDALGLIDAGESVLITNARQADSLRRGVESLRKASDSAKLEVGTEFIALDLRDAMDALGEITGEITSDSILNSIFANFCIGK